MTETAKKKRGMPSSFTILLALLAIVAVITVIVSGTSGGEVTAARLSDFCTAPVKGFADALPVCLFVMILGGFLGMMTETGALDNGIAVLVQKLKGNEIMLIPVLMLIFSLGGTTYGMCEETVPFYALLAATMMAAGFDPMVGAATVLLGAGCGCLGSTVNPFAVGAAVDALTGVDIAVNQSIIIGLGAKVSRTIRKLASENGVSIIATPLDTYTCAKVISQAVPVRHVMRRKGLITFEPEENVEDVKRTVSKKRIRYYPLLDEQGRELGLHLIWIPHDLMDPRTVSRRTMRDTVSSYMDTVMHATPVDESLLDFADDVCM